MGTRNLICVLKDNEFKVAKYCQWDGYPEGQGDAIREWLIDSYQPDDFAKGLENCYDITDDALHALWIEAGVDPDDKSGMVSMDISNKFNKEHPQLGRDMGAGVLDLIQHSTGPVALQNEIDFAQESLFCEWVYVLNLDTDELEVYTGFNKEPVTKGRFAGPVNADGYAPVRLVATFDIFNLPEKDEFIAVCEERETELLEGTDYSEAAAETALQDLRTGAVTAPVLEHIIGYVEENMDSLMEYIAEREL